MRSPSPASQAPRVEYDFTNFAADDSGACEHRVVPPTADEVAAEIAAIFVEFSAAREVRS